MPVVNIRLGAETLTLEVDAGSTAFEIKQQLARERHISVDKIRVIFCGQVVADSQSLQELDVGKHSILYAVVPQLDADRDGQREKLTECETQPSSTTTAATGQPLSYFFVYCKSPCGGLRPAKLRVTCGSCGGGAFELTREPSGWADVLERRRVTGTCHEPPCGEQQPCADFYFKCREHESGPGERAAVLSQVRRNTDPARTCPACLEEPDLLLEFTCRARHVLCLQCFCTDTNLRLSERRFIHEKNAGYSVPCPELCEDSLLMDAHHFRLLGDTQYERYQRYAAEEALLAAGGVLCPAPGCGAGFIPSLVDTRVSCTECNLCFCRECRRDVHPGPCEDVHNRTGAGNDTELRANEEASREAVNRISKKCPSCKTDTERSGGCMHMSCARCRAEWCWICVRPWTRGCQEAHWFG